MNALDDKVEKRSRTEKRRGLERYEFEQYGKGLIFGEEGDVFYVEQDEKSIGEIGESEFVPSISDALSH